MHAHAPLELNNRPIIPPPKLPKGVSRIQADKVSRLVRLTNQLVAKLNPSGRGVLRVAAGK